MTHPGKKNKLLKKFHALEVERFKREQAIQPENLLGKFDCFVRLDNLFMFICVEYGNIFFIKRNHALCNEINCLCIQLYPAAIRPILQ